MRLSCSLFTLALASLSLPALAEEPTARALFKEGRDLATKGDFAAACPKFEQSLKLEAGLGTQFNLADCWEHVGRTASARKLFLEAADAAKASGQAEREQVLRKRAEALDARVPKLLIETRPTTAKLDVRRDEEPIAPESWGKPQPIDPGSYTIVAKAPGRRTWRKKVEAKDGGGVVSVMIPDLMEAKDGKAEPAVVAAPIAAVPAKPAAAPAKPAAAEAKPTPAESTPKSEPEAKPEAAPAKPAAPLAFTASPAPATDRPSDLSYSVLGLGGLGVGALTFSAIMAFRYQSANDDAESICPTSRDCSARDIADHDRLVSRASTARTWSFVGAGVGLASVGSAVALYVIQHRSRPNQSAFTAVPLVGADGSLGASLSGSF